MSLFPRLDILPSAQRALWPRLAAVNRHSFVLYGGTAIALRFGRLGPPRRTPDGVMSVASLADLLAHKLKTVLQRVEPKDYLDVDAMLQNGLSLSSGLAGASLLFPAFARFELAERLNAKEMAQSPDGRVDRWWDRSTRISILHEINISVDF